MCIVSRRTHPRKNKDETYIIEFFEKYSFRAPKWGIFYQDSRFFQKIPIQINLENCFKCSKTTARMVIAANKRVGLEVEQCFKYVQMTATTFLFYFVTRRLQFTTRLNSINFLKPTFLRKTEKK